MARAPARAKRHASAAARASDPARARRPRRMVLRPRDLRPHGIRDPGGERRRARDHVRPVERERLRLIEIHHRQCGTRPLHPRRALVRRVRDGAAHRRARHARLSHGRVQVPARDQLALGLVAVPGDAAHGLHGTDAALGSGRVLVTRGRRRAGGADAAHRRPAHAAHRGRLRGQRRDGESRVRDACLRRPRRDRTARPPPRVPRREARRLRAAARR